MKLDYLYRGTPGHPLHPPLTDAAIGIYTFATIAAVLSKLGVAEPLATRRGRAGTWVDDQESLHRLGPGRAER